MKEVNCVRCGSDLPQTGAYCPICGAPRREIDRLILETRNAAGRAVEASVVAFDRLSQELQPAVDRAVAAIRPAVDEVGRVFRPFADTTVRVMNDVTNSLRPAAQRTATVARQVAHRTAVVVGPAVAMAAEKTEAAARRVKEAARRLG